MNECFRTGGFGTGVPLNAERKKREKDEAIAKAKSEGKDLLAIEKAGELMKEDGTPGECCLRVISDFVLYASNPNHFTTARQPNFLLHVAVRIIENER